MHRPVVARGLGELAGAVERVHDPDPVTGEPDLVVLALLGEHRVTRSVLGEQLHEQVVGGEVAGVLQLAALEPLLADLEQAAAGSLGQPARQHVVVGVGGGRPRVEGHRLSLVTPGRPAADGPIGLVTCLSRTSSHTRI